MSVNESPISHFADEDRFRGAPEYIRDNLWVPVFEVTWNGFNKENPRIPFVLWEYIGDNFRSLICAVRNFDPARRITAREASAHTWFGKCLICWKPRFRYSSTAELYMFCTHLSRASSI